MEGLASPRVLRVSMGPPNLAPLFAISGHQQVVFSGLQHVSFLLM